MNDPLTLIALASLAVTQAGDIITTRRALRHPNAIEKNPVIRWFMEHLGAGWWVAKAAAMVAVAYGAIRIGHPEAIFAASAVTAYVIWRNLKVLKKLEGGDA